MNLHSKLKPTDLKFRKFKNKLMFLILIDNFTKDFLKKLLFPGKVHFCRNIIYLRKKSANLSFFEDYFSYLQFMSFTFKVSNLAPLISLFFFAPPGLGVGSTVKFSFYSRLVSRCIFPFSTPEARWVDGDDLSGKRNWLHRYVLLKLSMFTKVRNL